MLWSTTGGDPLLENAGGDAPVDYLDYDVATALSREMLGAQFPCFASTKVQMLTPEAHSAALQQRRTGVAQRSEEEQNAIEHKILRAGTQFKDLLALLVQKYEYCITSTTVRMRGGPERHRALQRAQVLNSKVFTCFTSTTVRMLT